MKDQTGFEKVKLQQAKNVVGKKEQQAIIVQAGDAQEHLRRAMSKEKQEKQEGGSYEFGEMSQALGGNQCQFQNYQNYNYYQANPYQQGTMADYYQQNQPQQAYFHQYNPNHYWGHGGGRHWGRGRGRGRGRHWQSDFPENRPFQQNAFMPPPVANYQYQHPHHYGYGNPYYMYQYGIYQQGQQFQQNSEQVVEPVNVPVQSYEVQHGQSPLCGMKWRQKQHGFQGQGNHGRGCGKNFSLSHSSESSSDSDSERNSMKKKYNSEISEYYNKKMLNFFEERQIGQCQREKIIKILIKWNPKFDAKIEEIVAAVVYLEGENLLYYLSYVKVIKIILKFKFEMGMVVQRLSAIQAKKSKKFECDQRFRTLYGGQEMEPMINHHQLIEKEQAKVMYLIDGNNIMPSIKYFRGYFQSHNLTFKMQVQVRLRCLVGIGLAKENVCLFFDDQFQGQAMRSIQERLIKNAEVMQKYRNVPVIYGAGEKADERIIERVGLLSETKTDKEVILISSDRELFMRCKQKLKMGHSGGRFFFKFLRFSAKRVTKGNKQLRKVIKAMLQRVD